ncbi:MAG: hypothetical protein ISR95_03660 [Candidatus Marinimicrobia bacterium]|nr:hypothetical protein [Candidatus Neomarinimicrobiota bacterium]
MDREYRCPECGALQTKKDRVKGECWKCEQVYKESDVNGDWVLVEDNSRGVRLGHDTDEDIKADISFKCSYCDIEVSERLSDGHHTYWHEPCNRSTRIIVTHGYMRHRELIEEDSSESEVSKAKLKQLKLKLAYLKLRQRRLRVKAESKGKQKEVTKAKPKQERETEEEPVTETDIDSDTKGIWDKHKIMNEIEELIVLCEKAIDNHPAEDIDIYRKGRDAFIEGQLSVKESDRPTANPLTMDETSLIQRYMLASSFISAWYHLAGDKANRDKAANSCATLVSGAGPGSEIVLRKYIEYEQTWRKTMKREGVTPSSGGSFGPLFIVTISISVLYWIFSK